MHTSTGYFTAGYFITFSLSSIIVWVSVVLRRAVGDSDWRFDSLSGSHLQSLWKWLPLRLSKRQPLPPTSSFQNYTHPDDHTRQTTDTSGFKPFTTDFITFVSHQLLVISSGWCNLGLCWTSSCCYRGMCLTHVRVGFLINSILQLKLWFTLGVYNLWRDGEKLTPCAFAVIKSLQKPTEHFQLKTSASQTRRITFGSLRRLRNSKRSNCAIKKMKPKITLSFSFNFHFGCPWFDIVIIRVVLNWMSWNQNPQSSHFQAGQSKQTQTKKRTNQDSTQIQLNGEKFGKTCARISRLVSVLLLIGWETGANLIS